MRNKKLFKKLLAASLAISSLTFALEICYFPQLTSIAHAEIQTFKGVGEDIGSDDEPPAKSKQRAKENAERNALEQAGIFLSTHSTSVNGKLTKDEIVIVAGGILQVIEVKPEAIPVDPNNAFAYNNRGVAYDDLKKYEMAIADYNKAIQLNPNLASAYYIRGNAYKALGDNKKAQAELGLLSEN